MPASRSLRHLCVNAACGLALMCATTVANAARTFPPNSFQTRVAAVSDDTLEAHGTAYHLAPGVLVYTTSNSTLVRSAIPVGAYVRVQLDFQGDVRRVWILADDEIASPPWWRFWNRDETQDQTAPQVYIAPTER